MLDISHMMQSLDGDGSHGPIDFKPYDLDKNNIIDSRDCPFVHGSPEAKLWFINILQPYLVDHPADPASMIAMKLEIQHGLSPYSAFKVAKKVIELVTKRAVLDKELNTYALGLPKLYEEKHYTDEIIHGRLNQVVARTGRLSSSEPNCQNLSGTILPCFITRF